MNTVSDAVLKLGANLLLKHFVENKTPEPYIRKKNRQFKSSEYHK